MKNVYEIVDRTDEEYSYTIGVFESFELAKQFLMSEIKGDNEPPHSCQIEPEDYEYIELYINEVEFNCMTEKRKTIMKLTWKYDHVDKWLMGENFFRGPAL